jgi:LmbE family N-acetylglucosaminyl deacetylase
MGTYLQGNRFRQRWKSVKRSLDESVLAYVMRVAIAPADIFSVPSVIFAAHPDDEIIGLGGILPQMKEVVTIVHVTDGSPGHLRDARAAGFSSKEEYAAARRAEALAALQLAGVSEHQQQWWEIGDQEASFRLTELTLRVAELLNTLRPARIFTHPYEGGHPDHDATAFAVHSARELLLKQLADVADLWEFTSYHAGSSEMKTSEFLPFPESTVLHIELEEEARALKRDMFNCFPTQREMLARFPISPERFRQAPFYNFIVEPHPGKLFYEQFDWGIDGPHWRKLAAEAQRRLGLTR